jgi:hypothetical protein
LYRCSTPEKEIDYSAERHSFRLVLHSQFHSAQNRSFACLFVISRKFQRRPPEYNRVCERPKFTYQIAGGRLPYCIAPLASDHRKARENRSTGRRPARKLQSVRESAGRRPAASRISFVKVPGEDWPASRSSFVEAPEKDRPASRDPFVKSARRRPARKSQSFHRSAGKRPAPKCCPSPFFRAFERSLKRSFKRCFRKLFRTLPRT